MPRGDEIVRVSTSVAPVEEHPLPTPEEAQRVAQLHRELRLSALRVTSSADWLDLDGRPYLQASGCQRLMALFRIRTQNVRAERVDDGDDHYTVVVTGEAMSEVLDPHGWVTAVGTASSRDPLLTRGGRVKAAYGDILKKAFTSFYARSIRQLVGLGGLTWEDLEAVGIKRSGAARVEYAKEKQEDLVYIEVPFPKKDELRDLVRKHCGVAPKWDGTKKQWGVPKQALSVPEIVALTIFPDQKPAEKQAEKPVERSPKDLFDGGEL